MEPLHRSTFRVALADVDAAQLVYYAAPLVWAERLASDWLASVGLPVSGTLAAGAAAPAVHVEIDYRSPLRLDDEVVATLWAGRVTQRSFTLISRFRARGGEHPAIEVQVTQVWVQTSEGLLAAVALPGELRAHLND